VNTRLEQPSLELLSLFIHILAVYTAIHEIKKTILVRVAQKYLSISFKKPFFYHWEDISWHNSNQSNREPLYNAEMD